MICCSEDYLCHHGIKGQKWGVRRFQNKDGSLTPEGIVRYGYKVLKKSKSSNLDKFGKSRDTNVLYITGQSGSGKSTAASSIYKKGDTIIRLDGYSEGSGAKIQDKNFNKYLDKNVKNWRDVPNATGNTQVKIFSNEYWKKVDKIANAIEEYSKIEYDKNHRVIVEGLQVADGWLRENKGYYLDKPVISLSTSPVVSALRAAQRDEKNIFENTKETFKNYKTYNSTLNEFNKEIGAKRSNKEDVMSLYRR